MKVEILDIEKVIKLIYVSFFLSICIALSIIAYHHFIKTKITKNNYKLN
jgi:hypothetical protein